MFLTLKRIYFMLRNFQKTATYFGNFTLSFVLRRIQVTHQTLLKGDSEEGIYKLTTSPTPLAFIGERTSPTKWHDRLGHPHCGILLNILNKYGLSKTHKTLQYVCDAYSLAKSHKLPFSQSTYKSTRPLALIHSDVCGPAPITSLFGYSYYVIFVDDYSKYIWLFPMKKKSDVFSIFYDFHIKAERQFSTKLQSLQSD